MLDKNLDKIHEAMPIQVKNIMRLMLTESQENRINTRELYNEMITLMEDISKFVKPEEFYLTGD